MELEGYQGPQRVCVECVQQQGVDLRPTDSSPGAYLSSPTSQSSQVGGSSRHRDADTAQLLRRIQMLEEEVKKSRGVKCTSLLFVGSCFGFTGFLLAFTIGFLKFWIAENYEGKVYDSGWGYFPSTVSEMVYDPREPAGKCFFAFELLASLMIFMSWYPWELRNVYVGDDSLVPFLGCSWMMMRQYSSAPGMSLLAIVTTTPFAKAEVLDFFCISIHLGGAVMMFGGYILAEGYTLSWGPFRGPDLGYRVHGRKEGYRFSEVFVRKALLTGIFIFYMLFSAFQGLLLVPDSMVPWEVCCYDVWSMPHNGTKHAVVVLEDTASRWVLVFKVASYLCEVICGLLLILSHLAIWWYCQERHVDLIEGLPELHLTESVRPADLDVAARPSKAVFGSNAVKEE